MILSLLSLMSACRTENKTKINVCNKMETDKFEKYLKLWEEDFDKNKTQVTINELRDGCKTALEKGVAKFVPVKTIKKRDKLPWVSNTIETMIRKRNSDYRKMRDSKSDEDTNMLDDLKSQKNSAKRNKKKYIIVAWKTSSIQI